MLGTWVTFFLHLGNMGRTATSALGCCGIPSSSILSGVEMDICIPESDVGDALVAGAFLFILSSVWVVGCCSTLSIFVLFVAGEGTASFGDFLLVVGFSFSGLSFLGCCCLSIVILFGVGTGCVVGTSTVIVLRSGTGTSAWVGIGTATGLAIVTGMASGASLVAATVGDGSGEGDGDLDETGGVGRVDGFGEADERVLRVDDGDLCLLRLGGVGGVDGGGGVGERGLGGDEVDLLRLGGVGRVDGGGGVDERGLLGDEGDLLRLGGVGRVDGRGGVDERGLLGDDGDLLCLFFFSGILAGDGDLLRRFLDVFLGLLLLDLVASLFSWDCDLNGDLGFIGDLDVRSKLFHVSARFSSFCISCSLLATESSKAARVIFLMSIFSSKVLRASSSLVGCMFILTKK